MVELRSSRSGELTASSGGVALHSGYDPVREAERFVLSLPPGPSPSTVLVLGEGVGHISRAVRRHHPSCRVLAVYYDTELWRAAAGAADASWHPGSPEPLERFLERELSELEVEGLRLLEWPPSSAAFPARSRAALDAAAALLRRLNGNIATTARAGRRWLRNSLLNFMLGPAPETRLPLDPARPLVIAASGPSLADALELLCELEGRVGLWALPSAVDALLAAGIEPDLVVLTDPVYYSVYHTHAARGRELPVALPLSAAPGIWRVTSRVVCLAQPTFYEAPLAAALGGDAPRVPCSGTVAGSALALALGALPSPVPVVFAGLDFCYRDVLSHARPNAFEHFLLPGSGRLSPLHHRLCAGAFDAAPIMRRGNAARTSLSLETYAGWFAAGEPEWQGRVRRLFPSPVELPALRPISPEELGAACPRKAARPSGRPKRAAEVDRAARARVAGRLIAGWRALLASEPEPPGGPTPAREIAWHLSLADLLEVRRIARRDGEQRARSRWAELTRELDAHLAGLLELVRSVSRA